MNPRRDFFRQLFVGASALPVVVKAVVSEQAKWRLNPEWENARKLPEGWHGTPQDFMGELQWCYTKDIQWDYRWEGDRLIQSSKGKDCVIYKLDQNPLRFTL